MDRSQSGRDRGISFLLVSAQYVSVEAALPHGSISAQGAGKLRFSVALDPLMKFQGSERAVSPWTSATSQFFLRDSRSAEGRAVKY